MTSPAHTRPVLIVLDVDTGVDDACALLLAALHPDLDSRAVSCVGGNASVDDVVRNTLVVLEAAGCTDVPVAWELPGPCSSTLSTRATCTVTTAWPTSAGRRSRPDPTRAMPSSCCATAPRPLPRVCRDARPPRAAHQHRAAAAHVSRSGRRDPEIVFMAGAADVGNATASAEFNVFHDPEAAAIALDAAADLGIPVTMYGLEVFYKPVVTREEAAELSRSVAEDQPVLGAAPAVPARALHARRLDDRRRRGRLRGHRPGVADDQGAAGARRAGARGHAGAPSSTAATGLET